MGSQFNQLKDHRDIPVNPLAKWKKKNKFAIYAIKAQSNYNAK